MKRVVIMLLRAYKWASSPMLPPACRYIPSCSEYAMEAVEHYGAVRGGLKAVWRVLRCHPLAGGGYDPPVSVAVEQALLDHKPGFTAERQISLR